MAYQSFHQDAMQLEPVSVYNKKTLVLRMRIFEMGVLLFCRLLLYFIICFS